MCLALAGRVASVDTRRGAAVVEAHGRRWEVSLAPIVLDGGHVDPGDWVLVHTGFAMAVVDERAALEILAATSLGPPPGTAP
jgi:hydrogenase expression/formation protein HypC